MAVDYFVGPILNNLKEAIRGWRPPVPEEAGANPPVTLTDKIKMAAGKLGVSDKTIWNWLNNPEDHPIPLRKVFEICAVLETDLKSLLPGCPQARAIATISNPVAAEQTLLEIEREIAKGGMRRVCFPLFSAILFLEPLCKAYATKGMHHGLFSVTSKGEKTFMAEGDLRKRFLDLRAERRNEFAEGNYVLRVLFMRDEFEKYVNGERLFRQCTAQERNEQIQHLVGLLETKVSDGRPRLEMRLTKSFFRAQYAINTRPDGSDILVLNTNSGYAVVRNMGTEEFLKREFEIMWEDATYKGLRTSEEWVPFLGNLQKEIEQRASRQKAFKGTERRPAEPTDRRRIDLKAIMEGRAAFSTQTH